MTRKAITTSHAVVSCDVCGRTLLRGEHADVFLHGGQRRMVCELCTPRAAHEGWIREGLDDARVRDRGEGRSRSLLGRLRTRLAEVPPPAAEPAAPRRREPELDPLLEEEPVYEPPQPEPEPVYDAVGSTSPRRARSRGAHERRPQGRARGRAVQRSPSTRAPSAACRGRSARRSSPSGRRDRGQRRDDRRGVGAQLVPLRGRPRQRGRRASASPSRDRSCPSSTPTIRPPMRRLTRRAACISLPSWTNVPLRDRSIY